MFSGFYLAIASPSPSPSRLQESRSPAIKINNHQPGFSLILTFPAITLVLCKNTTCFSWGILGSCYSKSKFQHHFCNCALSAYHVHYNQYLSLNQFPIFTYLKSRHITVINEKPVITCHQRNRK